jgi:3',5'-nucleoside bisphosphate phosphatase
LKRPLDYKSGNIDLHIHSRASDGSLAPLDILYLAREIRLAAFALTDHDAIDGAREIASVIGMETGFTVFTEKNNSNQPDPFFISGVEISAAPPPRIKVSGSFHILGYGFDLDHPELNKTLTLQQAARKNRNPQIIARLNDMGVDISLAEVAAASGGSPQIGRPHIAALMVEKGYARSIDDAFDNYIGKGKPAYVDKPRITVEAAINLIRSAGGIAVLAHPGLLTVALPSRMSDLIGALTEMGLGGLEVYYPGHDGNQFAAFFELARVHNLLVTGGTDFHGEVNPDIRLGTGRGNFNVPFSVYENLTTRLDS